MCAYYVLAVATTGTQLRGELIVPRPVPVAYKKCILLLLLFVVIAGGEDGAQPI